MCIEKKGESTIPNSDALNWIIGPATQCISLIAEETRVASLLQRAIAALAHLDPLLDIARQRLKSANKEVEVIDRLISEQRNGLGRWASELIEEDFDSINRHGIIGIWVAVEVAMEDTAVLILTKDTSALRLVADAGVKLPQSLVSPLTVADAHRVYKRLEVHARKDRSVVDGYRHLMSILCISFTLPPEIINLLAELNYVRNCLLHRGGIADERAVIEAPGLSFQLGELIKIPSKRYLHYFDAVGKFALALLAGALNSRYVQTRDHGVR
jgi:hypothetical protein